MFTQHSRHRLLQRLFWNPVGAKLVHKLIRYEQLFTTVVRNYSLIDMSNGERWFPTLTNDQALAFDVGFYDGASTSDILLARPKARVIGFDPSRFARQCYERDFAADARISFENVGLSNQSGELEFHDYENMCNSFAPRHEMPGQTPTVYKVPVTTLDEFCMRREIERINLLKIDAEGYDLNVLEGAHGLLCRQAVDLFMFEFASGWSGTKRYLWEVHEYFKPLPYTLYRLFNGFLCPMDYSHTIDSCCTLSAIYVGVSNQRMAIGNIPVRNYRF